MNIILTSALSGIIFMFSGFVLKDKRHLNLLAVVLFGAMIISAYFQLQGQEILQGKYTNMLENDPFRVLFFILFCFIGIYYTLVNRKNFTKPGNKVSDYFALIFISFTGIAVLASFNNLLLMFLGIEILSIPMYALAGAAKHKMKSTEAAVKYFLMGSFSTGIMLMGIALIYGASGSFLLDNLINYSFDFQSIYYLGWVMLILSLCFKVSVAPMHFWAPDVYDGTPTVFSSFMITVVKGASFMTFISLLSAFKFDSEVVATNYKFLLSFIIILTLILGNFSALKQASVKRMLAYSSVVQAGFMMFALFNINPESKYALVYYTVSYSLASIVLFYVLTQVKNVNYKGFNGLAKRSPILAFSTTIALLSLAGIPFTSGFLAKFMILSSAMEDPSNLILVIAALVLAVLSIYYYIKVVIAMYFHEGKNKGIKLNGFTQFLLILGTSLTLALGIYPDLLKMFLTAFVPN